MTETRQLSDEKIPGGRRTRLILFVSFLSAMLAGAAVVAKSSFPVLIMYREASFILLLISLILVTRKGQTDGRRSLLEPPMLASLALLLFTGLVCVRTLWKVV